MAKNTPVGRLLAVAGILFGAATAAPKAAPAQAKFELTPFFTSYYPLLKMCSDCLGNGSNIRFRQLSSAGAGGRLTYWVSSTLGLEGSAAFTPSRVEFSADSGGIAAALSGKGNVLLVSGRLLYRPARTNLHFIMGGGIVHRGGDAWQGGEKLTKPAAVIGLGVRASVTPKLALNFSAEANLYPFDPDGSSTTNGSKLQSDVLVSIGIPITLSR